MIEIEITPEVFHKDEMSNIELTSQELCLRLMSTDTEAEVIRLLSEAGFWDNPDCWRYYGDIENNYSTIGNQQSNPDAALVEKLINAVDARLMNECLVLGIDPEGPDAPKDIKAAVARFFESDYPSERAISGLVSEWANAKRTEVARGITLAATGERDFPCYVISDNGEGQTPNMVPNTFVSIKESNKLRVPFVQGKFNMGGTGVLNFCGRGGLQLILTRRNPLLLGSDTNPSDYQWGFTVVRRVDPTGNIRSSVYTYLAPMNASENPGKGGILRFSAETMPIFPEGQLPYHRHSGHGTLIKLYEYKTRSRTHMFLDGGIQSSLDILLTDLALPIRLHECRNYRGKTGSSFETNLTGIKVRLGDDKTNNLEEGFPDSSKLMVLGEEMKLTIYAFKKGKARSYRGNEGILLTMNGQTQGILSADFFRRKNVGLEYLRNDLLVIVDCSDLSGRSREDLFKNSRDRLSDDPLKRAIEDELEELLKRHSGLRELREKRRREEIASKLDDAKPLEDVLENLLKQSPTLSTLFLKGKRLSNPFKSTGVSATNEEFSGNKFPSYFKFYGKEYGFLLERRTPINQRSRIRFETDTTNDYLDREQDPGRFQLYQVMNDQKVPVQGYVINLHNGIATLSVRLPENCDVSDRIDYLAVVEDATQVEPFENRFSVEILGDEPPSGGQTHPRLSPGEKAGLDRDIPTGISMPHIVQIFEADWQNQDPPFDQFSALRVKFAGDGNGNGDNGEVYDFFVNMDNVYLKNELKQSKGKEIELARAQYRYGLVLMGLGLLHDDLLVKKGKKDPKRSNNEDEGDKILVEDKIEQFTRAIAPMLLPIIDSLGSLSLDQD